VSSYPTDFKYTKDHEWVRLQNNEAAVGITDFAQRQLGDIVFLELPAVGQQVKQGDVLGQIESVKAVSELFAPVSGEVIATNADLVTHPEAINTAPHDSWMVRIRPSAPAETGSLLDAAAYESLVK
jgi:glycine cleavage system H protein